MGDTKTLTDSNAVEKIREFAKDEVCLFCTVESGKIVSRPMATQAIDADGAIWFFSKRDSEKNKQLMTDATVYLMYMNTGKSHYLTLAGFANIVDDREKARQLWTPLAKAWFENGVDDPDLTLIKVVPEEGHYWDTKNGKLVSMVKIAFAAITGKSKDGGVEGELQL